jgi:hypothetical protein
LPVSIDAPIRAASEDVAKLAGLRPYGVNAVPAGSV